MRVSAPTTMPSLYRTARIVVPMLTSSCLRALVNVVAACRKEKAGRRTAMVLPLALIVWIHTVLDLVLDVFVLLSSS